MFEYFYMAAAILVILGGLVIGLGLIFLGVSDFYFNSSDGLLFKDYWFPSVIKIVSGVALMILVLGGLLAWAGGSNHGSCKYFHYSGKNYICDEYYPAPLPAQR